MHVCRRWPAPTAKRVFKRKAPNYPSRVRWSRIFLHEIQQCRLDAFFRFMKWLLALVIRAGFFPASLHPVDQRQDVCIRSKRVSWLDRALQISQKICDFMCVRIFYNIGAVAILMLNCFIKGNGQKFLVLPGFPWVTPVRNWPGRGLDRHRRSRWLS